MGSGNNRLEILINLIYLARQSTSDLPALQLYLAEAELQVMALAAFPPDLDAAASELRITYISQNGQGNDAAKDNKDSGSQPHRLRSASHTEPLNDL